MIMVRTPVIHYDNSYDETPQLPNISISKFREILRDNSQILSLEKQQDYEQNNKGIMCSGMGLSRYRLRKDSSDNKKSIFIKRTDIQFDTHKNNDNKSPYHNRMHSKLSLRNMSQHRGIEFKFLKKKLEPNDILIVDKIPTPNNLYSKEFFSVNKNRIVRKSRLYSVGSRKIL